MHPTQHKRKVRRQGNIDHKSFQRTVNNKRIQNLTADEFPTTYLNINWSLSDEYDLFLLLFM